MVSVTVNDMAEEGSVVVADEFSKMRTSTESLLPKSFDFPITTKMKPVGLVREDDFIYNSPVKIKQTDHVLLLSS